MKITEDQKARINRVFVNGLIVVISAAITALMQFLSQIDFGQWTGMVVSLSAVIIKSVQAWAEPVQDIYRGK
jgi:hypothetical protein